MWARSQCSWGNFMAWWDDFIGLNVWTNPTRPCGPTDRPMTLTLEPHRQLKHDQSWRALKSDFVSVVSALSLYRGTETNKKMNLFKKQASSGSFMWPLNTTADASNPTKRPEPAVDVSPDAASHLSSQTSIKTHISEPECSTACVLLPRLLRNNRFPS